RRLDAPGGDGLPGEGLVGDEDLGGPGDTFLGAGEALEHAVGPVQEGRPVVGGDAEGVADHDHREPGGDVHDEVALTSFADGVDDLVAGPPHRRLALLHAPGREALVDELAALQVGGIVHVDHHRYGSAVGPDAARVREQCRVLRDLPQV